MIRVTVWNEYLHEKNNSKVAAIYPEGIHGCIAKFLKTNEDMVVRTATLEEPEHGLTQEVLDNTDVLLWWGHMAHNRVEDEIVERVHKRVLAGMGLICLHSGHASKIFRKLCGTNAGELKWRDDDEKEILWVVDPAHPIVQGIGNNIGDGLRFSRSGRTVQNKTLACLRKSNRFPLRSVSGQRSERHLRISFVLLGRFIRAIAHKNRIIQQRIDNSVFRKFPNVLTQVVPHLVSRK